MCVLPNGRALAKYMRLGNCGRRQVEARSLQPLWFESMNYYSGIVINHDRTGGDVTNAVCSSASASLDRRSRVYTRSPTLGHGSFPSFFQKTLRTTGCATMVTALAKERKTEGREKERKSVTKFRHRYRTAAARAQSLVRVGQNRDGPKSYSQN